MSILDITYPGMEDMDLYEKRKMIMAAMRKAKILNHSNIQSVIIILSFVNISVATITWFATGFVLASMNAFLLVALISLFIINKTAKPYYLPFIQEVINDKAIILGSYSHRAQGKKIRNITLILIMLIPMILFFISKP